MSGGETKRGPLFIAADLHGNAANTKKLLAACAARGGRLLLLGDLLSHGGRSLFAKLPPVEEQLSECGSGILAVRGNCDRGFDLALLPFDLADSLTLLEDGHLLQCTHGHLYGESCPPRLPEGAVLITGHTHIPAWRDHGSWYYANPGSLGQARGGAPESYMVYEDSCFRWYDADGQVWMEKRI